MYEQEATTTTGSRLKECKPYLSCFGVCSSCNLEQHWSHMARTQIRILAHSDNVIPSVVVSATSELSYTQRKISGTGRRTTNLAHFTVTPQRELGAVFADLGRCNASASGDGEPAAQTAWETLACQMAQHLWKCIYLNQHSTSAPWQTNAMQAFCQVGVSEYRRGTVDGKIQTLGKRSRRRNKTL